MAEADTTVNPSNAKLKDRSRYQDIVRALHHRNFQLFFSGQMISVIGTWMQNVAQSWLVYRLTGSALLLGVVGFAGQIPVSLLAPLGGLVADRWNRHHVVIGTQTASMLLAFVLSVLTLLRVVRVWEIVVLAALLGAVNAFDIPARQSFIIQMVDREDLMNAIALNSSMFNSARIIGPAIAGLLVAWIGEGWCFFTNSMSYIAVIAGLLLMKLEPVLQDMNETPPLEHIAEGFRYVRRTAPILALMLLLGLVSLVAVPYTVLMPIFADRILHGGARGLGLLMGATGVGALLGALTLAARRRVRGLGRWVAYAAMAFGISLVAFSSSRWFGLSLLLLVPVGYCFMLQMAGTNTLIQSMVPDELRGRVMSVYALMFMGMVPFGSFFSGALASRIGAQWTVAIGGVGAIAAGFTYWRWLPRLRFEARQLLKASGLGSSEPVKRMATRSIP
jgi:MFS family permease